jgi:1-phosphatidylinositol-4-phosphate 5-kinase
MNNIFLTKNNLMIHEKYDIKGSWIKRNADLPKEGDMATCRLCEQKFRYQSIYLSINMYIPI